MKFWVSVLIKIELISYGSVSVKYQLQFWVLVSVWYWYRFGICWNSDFIPSLVRGDRVWLGLLCGSVAVVVGCNSDNVFLGVVSCNLWWLLGRVGMIVWYDFRSLDISAFFIFFKLSKTMYFHEKSVIISLFLVRFQIRLNHMKDLLILHVTKEKNIKKVLYRCCKIA